MEWNQVHPGVEWNGMGTVIGTGGMVNEGRCVEHPIHYVLTHILYCREDRKGPK